MVRAEGKRREGEVEQIHRGAGKKSTAGDKILQSRRAARGHHVTDRLNQVGANYGPGATWGLFKSEPPNLKISY